MSSEVLSINDKKMNFAMSNNEVNSFNLIACTFDAKWSNKCELRTLKLVEELSWLSVGPAFEFDMVEGMCAHKVILTPDYIVFSCSKLFKDGSIRKLRVLSLDARTKGRPTLILE